MRAHLLRLRPRDDESALAPVHQQSDTRRGVAPRTTIGALAVAVALCVLLTPGAAYANTNRVEIVNAATNLRADVMWASVHDGQGVFLWPNNLSASQEFDLINMGQGFFQIRARHSGKCLMVDRTQVNVGNGRRIAQYPCTAATYKSAQWSFGDMNGPCVDTAGVPAGNALLRPWQCVDTGRRVIRNRWHSTKCLDTANPSGKRPGQKAVLQLWTCISSPSAWNADNQIWKIIDPVTRRTITNPS